MFLSSCRLGKKVFVMRINGDNYSNFGEMVVKYGIPEPPKPRNKKKTSHSDNHFIIKPFVRVTPEMLQADEAYSHHFVEE